MQRRGRVEADHQVEPAVADQVEVRGRVHAAVDVAAPADLDRVVEAGDRAGGGDRVGEVGRPARRRGRTGPGARWRSRRRRPSARVVAPAVGDDAADDLLQRLGGDEAARHPAGEQGGGRVAVRRAQGPQRQPPGARAERRQRPLEPEPRAAGAVGLGRRAAAGVDDAVEGLAGRVGDHEPGRDPGDAQRADHRAGRGADDDRRRVAGSQPVWSASASSPPVSQAPPWTPPAPRTRPTRTREATPAVRRRCERS